MNGFFRRGSLGAIDVVFVVGRRRLPVISCSPRDILESMQPSRAVLVGQRYNSVRSRRRTVRSMKIICSLSGQCGRFAFVSRN